MSNYLILSRIFFKHISDILILKKKIIQNINFLYNKFYNSQKQFIFSLMLKKKIISTGAGF